MANKEVSVVNSEVLNKRLTFFASTIGACFGDFLQKASSNDRLGAMIAAVRIAQLGQAMLDEYKANFQSLCVSVTELRAARQAAKLMVELINRNGTECGLRDDDVPDTSKTIDRSQN